MVKKKLCDKVVKAQNRLSKSPQNKNKELHMWYLSYGKLRNYAVAIIKPNTPTIPQIIGTIL